MKAKAPNFRLKLFIGVMALVFTMTAILACGSGEAVVERETESGRSDRATSAPEETRPPDTESSSTNVFRRGSQPTATPEARQLSSTPSGSARGTTRASATSVAATAEPTARPVSTTPAAPAPPPPRATEAPLPEPTPAPMVRAVPEEEAPKFSLEEEREALVALYEALDGRFWQYNYNWASEAPVSDWGGIIVDRSGHVVELHLNENLLAGQLPPELGKLTQLTVLSLFGNSLNGEIPAEIGNLINLQQLSLYENALSGEIPRNLDS